MSGRMGDRKTFGSGWVLSLGLPFGPMMLTTGLLVILRMPGDEQMVEVGNEGEVEVLPSRYEFLMGGAPSHVRCVQSRVSAPINSNMNHPQPTSQLPLGLVNQRF
jgi:hypothetical protein